MEPDKKRINLIKRGYNNVHVIQGKGEKIPFHDNSFDIVTCFNVLEHTPNWKKVVDEMFRVAKSGGVIFIMAPNYLFPYEGHYYIIYPPLCPKLIFKIYLHMLGRKTGYLKNIFYITSWSLFSYLKKYKNIKIYDLAEKKIMEKARKFNPLLRLAILFLVKLKLYQGSIILIRK